MSELKERLAQLTEEQQRDILAQLSLRSSPKPRNRFPLSSSQRRLWILDQIGAGSSAYKIPLAIRLNGRLNSKALEDSFREVVRRHQSLRTVFETEDSTGETFQVVLGATFYFNTCDLTAIPEPIRADKLKTLVKRIISRSFDLTEGPLIRASLVRTGDREHILVLTMHHIVSDGWSAAILTREVIDLYQAYSKGFPSPLPELPIQYVDFAAWQNKRLEGHYLDEQLEYWKHRLAPPLRALELPTRGLRPDAPTSRVAEIVFQIGSDLTQSLSALSRREGATLFMTLLAAFAVLLYRYTGQEDILIGTPVANRSRREFEGLIGLFINTLTLRLELMQGRTFWAVLAAVKEAALEAYANADIPFETVVEQIGSARDFSRSPAFQVMFALQNTPQQEVRLPDLHLEVVPVEASAAKFDLTVSMAETNAGMSGNWEYNADLFEPSLMERMIGHYVGLLRSLEEHSFDDIAQLPMLSDEEILQLTRWTVSKTLSIAPCRLLHEWFDVQAALAPDSVAVVSEEEHLSYARVGWSANKLANHLLRLGNGPESTVGLAVDRSPKMIVAILGVLKSGAAYVPLDPTYPQSRLKFVIENARIQVLLSEDSVLGSLPPVEAPIVSLDGGWSLIESESHRVVERAPAAENLAYVIYTSGSTGRPKGVGVCHDNVIRLFERTGDWYCFDRDDVWTLFHSYAFDFSVWEIWGALLYGGRLVIVSYALSRSPNNFYDLLSKERVTVLSQTPSAFRQLIQADQERGDDVPLSLRSVVFGGEALDLKSLKPWFRRHGDAKPKLINMYGITETTVHVTYRPLSIEDSTAVLGSAIGEPIPDLQLYVADLNTQLVPIGVPGQMLVGGAGLARGYLHNPALTAERFIPDPFGSASGSRLYKTGDAAKRISRSDIEYLGRIDHQVKIRGFRIELGEIEATLQEHEAVMAAVVLAREDTPGEKRLVAYILSDSPDAPRGSDLRAYLKGRLPEYMVPAAFVGLRSFPLTENGKLDRSRLPVPDTARLENYGAYSAPRSEIERILADAWADVLGLTKVGIDDNFFELGGDSIRTIQVLSRLKTRGLALLAQEFFQHQTIRGLAERVERANPRMPEQPQPFELISPKDRAGLHDDVEDAFPLTMLQAGMVFHSQYSPDSTEYHNVTSFRLRGRLVRDKLVEAVRAVIIRHPVLRASFDLVGFAEPIQLIHAAVEPDIEFEDLSATTNSEQAKALDVWLQAERLRRFDVTRAPLVRFFVHRLKDDTFQLTMTEHHAILDGWSVASLLAELFETYTQFCRGEGRALKPTLPILFREFVEAEREALQSREHKTFWQTRLNDFTTTTLPRLPKSFRKARELGPTRSVWVQLSPDVTSQISVLVGRLGLPLKSILLAIHVRALSFVSGEQDIVTGVVTHGRPEGPGGEQVLGLFLNTVPFRLTVQEESWAKLMRRVFEAERELAPHALYPLAAIQLDQGGKRLFEVAFNFINFHVLQGIERSDEIEVLDTASYADTDLTVLASFSQDQSSGQIRLNLTVRASEIGDDQLARIAECYARVFEAAVQDPNVSCIGLRVLSESEATQLFTESLVLRSEERESVIHGLVERQSERTPDAMAVFSKAGQITYSKLDRQASRVRAKLQELGVGPEDRVAVCLYRSIEMIASLIGILKSGAAYVPVEHSYPNERIAFMLEDSGAVAVVCQKHLIDKLPSGTAWAIETEVLFMEPAIEAPGPMSSSSNRECLASNLAYVIYTSGSTGKPKGVAIEHRSAVEFLLWATETFQHDDLAAVLASTSASFDLSIFEIFAPLISGGAVVLAENAMELPELECAANISLINTVPSAMSELLKLHAIPRSVRTVNLAGESLRGELAQEIYAQGRVDRVYNLYGPSEDTTYSTAKLVDLGNDDAPPIGRPISNTQAYVLDRFGGIAPEAVTGELCLAGKGLARGYLGRPDLTAEKFVPECLSGRGEGGRLYRTGDLARRLPHGEIDFQGRLDHQVKIRGFRIELGEVEDALNKHPEVACAVVIDLQHVDQSRFLAAYIVPKPLSRLDADALRGFLRSSLPDYMIPSRFNMLEFIPLTPNGKTDRAALRAIVGGSDLVRESVSPRDAFELRLAQLWQEVLGLSSVGVTDDFFDLGGHSLLAVRLMAKVKEDLGQDVPLSALIRGGTIESLAAALRKGTKADSILTVLQNHGSQTPFFLVHPVGGNVLCYVDLARHLGLNQPSYALQSVGVAGDRDPHTSIEDMAAEYVIEIIGVQPNGPYRIGGWSFGCCVAAEIAWRLRARGEATELLVLIDGWAPGEGANRRDSAEPEDDIALLSIFLADLLKLTGKEVRSYRETHPEALSDDPLKSMFLEAQVQGVLSSDVSLVQFSRLFKVFRCNRLAALNYRPSWNCLPEKTVLVLAEETTRENANVRTLGWDNLTKDSLAVRETPGNHYSILRKPNVEFLAATLTELLTSARST